MNQLTQLERVLTWLLRRGGLLTLLRPGLAAALRLRNVLRGRGAASVPVLSSAMRPEVLLFLPAGKVKRGVRPREIERRLWGGYSRYALEELGALATGREIAPQRRSEACWVLARWYSAGGDFQRALDYAVLMRSVRPAEAWFKGQILLEVDCLNRLGLSQRARAILDEVRDVVEWHPDYCLAYANTCAGDETDAAQKLYWINQALAFEGFAPIERLRADTALAIDNLHAPAAGRQSRRGGPKVSVLMPAYNSAETIEKALRGLLDQTWDDLEIIPVDDCSRDHTWGVLQAYAERHPRVRPVQHRTNTGAYGARLTALSHATGEFITVHDADDWSHPQKIEVQVDAMLQEPALVATMTSWCRVSRNLYVNRVGVIPSAHLQRQNESSVMFRRSLVDEIGAWDRVRAAGDTEYIWRIQAAYGKDAMRLVHPDVPLSFSLSQEDSLTRSGPTHVRTIFYGTRRVYREAQRWWHRQASTKDFREVGTKDTRGFHAPPNLLSRHPEARAYDLIVVADLAMRLGVGRYTRSVVQAAVEQGLRVAVFHWGRYDKPAMRPVRDYYQFLASTGAIDIVAADDELTADTALVTDAMSLTHILDYVPKWDVTNVYVTAGHSNGSGFPEGANFNPRTIMDHVVTAYGVDGNWLAVSAKDRELMLADPEFTRVGEEILPGLVPMASFDRDPTQRHRDKPIAGRFSYSQESGWPEDSQRMKHAYCADKDCTVMLYGFPRQNVEALGRTPRNWTVVREDFDHHDVVSYSDPPELDFFLYYPGDVQLEAGGIAVYEAAAAGQVIIAPPELEPIFGPMAIYCPPENVIHLIRKLWADPDRRWRQQQLARDKVRQLAGAERLSALLRVAGRERV